MMKKEKLVIGRKDIVDLPNFDLINVPAKIDTGAYTSSLHCDNIEVVNDEGILTLTFNILDFEGKVMRQSKYSTTQFAQRLIKSSTGIKELRYVIQSQVIIYGETYVSEFSLSDRNGMKFPILIGRKLLRRRFVVDVSKTNLSYKRKISSNL